MDDGIDPPIGDIYKDALQQLAAGRTSGIGLISSRPNSIDDAELNQRFLEIELNRFCPDSKRRRTTR